MGFSARRYSSTPLGLVLGLSLFGMAEAAAAAECGGTCGDVCGGEPDGPTHDYELPLPTTPSRKLSAPGSGPPAEITITTMGLTAGNLVKMAHLLETVVATVNADPNLLPNTKLRGLALLEGSSDSGFMQAVDYAHMVEGSCVSFGVQKGANQNIIGPVAAGRNTNHGFSMDTVLGTGKSAADFGTTFGVYGWSQIVARLLDMAATANHRRFGLVFPKSFAGLTEQLAFEEQKRDVSIALKHVYDHALYHAGLSFEEADKAAENLVDIIIKSQVTLIFMCFCSTKNVDFRVQVLRRAFDAGLFSEGYQWYSHYGSVKIFKEPLLKMDEYKDLRPILNHMKVMDFPSSEPEEYGDGGAAPDDAAFNVAMDEALSRFNMSDPQRGFDSFRWLDCDGTHAGQDICNTALASVAHSSAVKLEHDAYLSVALALHDLIYVQGQHDFCDVDALGRRTGSAAAFLNAMETVALDSVSGHQQWERVALVGGNALVMSRTWMLRDWETVETYENGGSYAANAGVDMFAHRTNVVNADTGAKEVIHADWKSGEARPMEQVKWMAGAVGTPAKDWFFGMCGMTAKVDEADPAKSCVPCPFQHFHPLGAENECVPIDTFSCPPGTAMDPALISSGMEPCVPCPEGTYSPGGSRVDVPSCLPCPLGHFTGEEGKNQCDKCRDSFTTEAVGSTSATACVCATGTFWNRAEDTCEECPGAAFCAGRGSLPITYGGFYAEHVGDVSAATLDKQDAAKASGNYVKESGAYSTTKVYKCHSEAVCPGASKDVFDPATAATYEKENVRVAFPLPGACPVGDKAGETREGVACGRCQDKHYGGGPTCQECDGGASAGGAVLVILVPFVIACIYRGTTTSRTKRLRETFILVSTVGMLAFFLQTVAVFASMNIDWPLQLDWIFEFSFVFMFDMNGLSVACFHGQDFSAKYWASIIVPMFLVFATAVTYLATKVLPVSPFWKMAPNETFSMLGMLLAALYVSLVKVAVAFFECTKNPAADDTLAKYRDVICGSDTHNEATPAMAIGMVLYVIGFYLINLYAVYTAPSKWMDVDFRTKFKFAFSRWRPDRYYWGMLIMTRNLLVAFACVVSDQGQVQLVYAITCVVLTFSLTARAQPWREPVLSDFDVVSSILLTLVGAFGIVFLSLNREINLSVRYNLPVQGMKDDVETFAYVLVALIACFLALFGMLCLWCIMNSLPGNAEKVEKKYDQMCEALTKQTFDKVFSATFKEEAARVIRESTPFDHAGLRNFLNKIGADQATPGAGTSDTLSIAKAKEAAGGAQTVSA